VVLFVPAIAAAQPEDPSADPDPGDEAKGAPPVEEPTQPPPAPAPAVTPPPTAEPPVAATTEETAAPEEAGPLPVQLGGYVQPQVRLRQNSDADSDEDGFRFRRARLTLKGHRATRGVDLGVELESELTPEFQLLDAFVTAKAALPADGSWRLDLGQVKAPFSRQALLSDAVLQFVEKAEIASLAPDRQIGARVGVAIPALPMVELWGGIFNGEGRNRIQNVDEHFLYVGRVEIKPIGRGARLAESAFEDYVTIAANVMKNTLDLGDASDRVLGVGGDVAAGWRGISAAFEYQWFRHRFPAMVQPDYQANGWAAQAGYLVPLGGFLDRKLELAARVEEIDRNDAVPVDNPGDPNQSLRIMTGALSYYHARHDLKVQAAFSHVIEVESESRTGGDITAPNDVFLLQASFRVE